jgi:hypothetical protein
MAFSFVVCFCDFELIDFFAAELSPPLEPFDPLADPETKKAIETINIAESIIAEKVLKEE